MKGFWFGFPPSARSDNAGEFDIDRATFAAMPIRAHLTSAKWSSAKVSIALLFMATLCVILYGILRALDQ